MPLSSFRHRTLPLNLAVGVSLFGVPTLAAPASPAVSVTPPLTSAKTIQVTETIWEAQNGPTPGPLRLAGTMTFQIQRPDKFRVVFKETNPSKPVTYYISDGQTMVGDDGNSRRSQPTARAEWPFPMMGLLNNSPGTVSCVPAIREGKKILLAVSSNPTGRDEFWLDPTTHLLLRWQVFITFQGKTSAVMRTDYAHWVLNKPIVSAVFQAPSRKMQTR